MEAGRYRYITISHVNVTASLSKRGLVEAVAPEGNSQGFCLCGRFFQVRRHLILSILATYLFRQQRELVSITVEVGESFQLADAPRQVLKRKVESEKLAGSCFLCFQGQNDQKTATKVFVHCNVQSQSRCTDLMIKPYI